jgi:hypothetical protein
MAWLGLVALALAPAALARPTDGASDPKGHGYTVAEHAPFCTPNFCMHWVTTTADAPDLTDTDSDDVPNFVEDLALELQAVRAGEITALGWANPLSDGVRGGNGNVDVYLADLAGTGALGYTAADPGQSDAHHKFAYMVMDNDFADQADQTAAMQVTAAHEYNHVLQLAYDAAQDTWMMEATAVWMEDRVYDSVDDYLRFIPGWASLDEVPLAKTDADKQYGSAVWNMWLDAVYGADLIRDAWAGSAGGASQSFAPDAYDAALVADGHHGFSASFVSFVADVAEWRTASVFPEGAGYADAQRRGNLQVSGAQVSSALDHTAYALYTIPQPAGGWPAVLRLDGELPAGVTGGLALVARTGANPLAGSVTKVVQQLPDGGAGSVQLENPAGYGRITAVLVNADTDTTKFEGGDWVFSHDAQLFTAAAGASGAASEAPANTAVPVVSGLPREGSQLTATNGTWSGSAPMAYTRQWLRCDSDGNGCEDITNANGPHYTATEADLGHALRVSVGASNGAGDASAVSSAPTAAVTKLPANTALPTVSGATTYGSTMTATDGTWTGSPTPAVTREWLRCSGTDVASCVGTGATGTSYVLGAADIGSRMRVREHGESTAGSADATSAATAVVKKTTATINAPAKAKIGPALGGKLAVIVRCTGPCAATARFELTRAVAEKFGVAKVPARGSGQLSGAGRTSIKLVFSAKARKKLRNAHKLVGSLVVQTRDAGGTLVASRRGKLTLRR